MSIDDLNAIMLATLVAVGLATLLALWQATRVRRRWDEIRRRERRAREDAEGADGEGI